MPADSTNARPRGGWRGRATAAAAGLVLVTSLGTLGFSRAVGAGVETDHITTLVIGTMPVETRGGTPGMERLLAWAFDQFTGRGLPTPPVSSVTFRERDSCTGVTGWFSAGAVTVCFVEQEACADAECSRWRPWVKRTIVHELAHAWMSEWLPAHRIEAFMADVDLPTWAGDSWPWEERGVELAAETLAWASQDWPARVNARLGNPGCEDLTSYYRTLTGRPLNPAPDCTGPDLSSQDPGSPSRSTGTRTPTDSDTTECRIPITPNRTRTWSEPRAATAMPWARSCPTDAPRSVREAERGQGATRCGIAAFGRSAHPSATPTSPTEGVATVRNARMAASACIALMSLVPALPAVATPAPESMRAPVRIALDPGAPVSEPTGSCAGRGFAVNCARGAADVPAVQVPHGTQVALAADVRAGAAPATAVHAAVPHGAAAALTGELATTSPADSPTSEELRAAARVRMHTATPPAGAQGPTPHGATAALRSEVGL